MPKLMFMGWNWVTDSLDTYSARAPMAVSRGKSTGRLSRQAPGRLHAHQKAAGGGLHIALHAGHLPGKGDPGLAFSAGNTGPAAGENPERYSGA